MGAEPISYLPQQTIHATLGGSVGSSAVANRKWQLKGRGTPARAPRACTCSDVAVRLRPRWCARAQVELDHNPVVQPPEEVRVLWLLSAASCASACGICLSQGERM